MAGTTDGRVDQQERDTGRNERGRMSWVPPVALWCRTRSRSSSHAISGCDDPVPHGLDAVTNTTSANSTSSTLRPSDSAAVQNGAEPPRVDANLGGCDLRDSDLAHTWLSGADLRHAQLDGANLAGAALGSADLTSAVLASADLTGADLGSADLTSAVLTSADLAGADLTFADLTSAVLAFADLTGANLAIADLTDADLTSADLDHVDLYNPRWSSTTCPDGSNSDSNGDTCAGHGSTYFTSCDAASAAGVTPLRREDPGFRDGLDPDGNGLACE